MIHELMKLAFFKKKKKKKLEQSLHAEAEAMNLPPASFPE